MDSYLKGVISGMFGVLISHPFDTMKTLIQQGQPLPNYLKDFYRGLIPPLIGVGLQKGVVFGTYTYARTIDPFKEEYANIAFGGGIAGLSASVVVTPFERVKILLQNKSAIKMTLSPSYFFQGLEATFTRETPGFAIYFSVYEFGKNKLYKDQNKEITRMGSLGLGALAGIISWIPIYPQDRIKTRMQAQNKNFLESAFEIFKNPRTLYKGFHYALMRAVPLHSGAFFMFEFLNSNSQYNFTNFDFIN